MVLMLGWKTDKLQNCSIKFVDGDRSSKYPKRSEFVSEGIPFINADSISEGYLDFKKTNFITEEKFLTIKKGRLQKGDIILTTRGNGVGKTAYFSSICTTGLINAQLLIVRAEVNNIDSRFLYYLFTSPQFQVNLRNYVSGSAQPQIPIQNLKQIEVSYPPLPTQKKIAGILSAYDELIENNTRRIKILEEMAQTLYHEWFVKFRFPGHEHTKMVDSELGLIPEGWEVIKLRDVAKVISGFAFKSQDFQNEGIPVIKIKNIRTGIVDIADIQYVDSSFLSLNKKYHIKRGDLLISLTGSHLTQPNSVVGRVAIYSQSKKVCLLNQRAGKIFINNPDRCTIPYLFYLLSSEDKRRSIALMASGAASQANISPTQVESLDLLIPSTEVLNLFDQIIYPIFEQISNLEIKNSNLRQTRDLLLPKLISGEIDVEHLEITIEDIAA